MKRILTYLASSVIACGVLSTLLDVQLSPRPFIRAAVSDLQPVETALVLGAPPKNQAPTDVMADRVQVAAEAYHIGKVKKLLLSGDDGQFKHNELVAMRQLAIADGVSSTDIILDPHGYRTYESCKRATSVFHLTQAVVITQRFHLARGLFLCQHHGLEVQGLVADRHSYAWNWYFWIRDLAASVKAWLDIYVWPPAPPIDYIPDML